MKTLIVYASVHHGNTKRIAEAMASVLQADAVNVQDIAAGAVSSYDMIGVGSGIYMGKFHNTILKFIEANDWAGKKVFVFATSGMGRAGFTKPVEELLAGTVEELLAGKGAQVTGSWGCKGFDTYVKFFNLFGGLAKGHPNEQDIRSAKEFAIAMGKIG
jgi:flavodoxin